MTEFIRAGHFARHIRRMRMLYTERRSALVKAIGVHMGDMLEVTGAEAGMHLAAFCRLAPTTSRSRKKCCLARVFSNAFVDLLLEFNARAGLILGTEASTQIRFAMEFANSGYAYEARTIATTRIDPFPIVYA